MTKKKTWTVPIIKGTNIACTQIWEARHNGIELDECDPETYKFDATIQFLEICKGWGSGCRVFVKDTERTYTNNKGETKPVEYGVFLTDSYDIIMKMDHGVMSGTFIVVKRGQDYGIKLIK